MLEALAASRGLRGAFGEPAYFYPTIGSTNDAAARLAEAGASEGTTIVADEQTAGRGRSGRAWYSAPGAGLYVSVIVRPDAARPVPGGKSLHVGTVPSVQNLPSELAVLTLAAGVALVEAVRDATGLQADIKWPNDLVCGRRKLAGILTEASARGAALEAVVVGFGINVRPVAYPPDLADRATSIEAELGRPVDRGLVLARALVRLAAVREVLRRGDASSALDAWRRLSPASVGRRVTWHSPAGERNGTTAGIDADGALLVDTAGGRERVIAGEVTWR
jgi:BirA family transcriptional regulator, biotin operon repressor / biotin---[acetyl-CoA-carboxylase] ligase